MKKFCEIKKEKIPEQKKENLDMNKEKKEKPSNKTPNSKKETESSSLDMSKYSQLISSLEKDSLKLSQEKVDM